VLMSATVRSDVLLLTGAGEDFSVGREVDSPPEVTHADRMAMIGDVNAMLERFEGIVISAIQGRALGFASGLAVQSDIAIAAEGAVFGFDEIRKGFPPLIVSSYIQDHLLRKHVMDLLLSGRQLSAAEALAMGMVTRLVPDAKVEEAAWQAVEELRGSNVEALRRMKVYFEEIQEVPKGERTAYAVRAQEAWFSQNH
ncbi:MAG TPA: enoyl-CoA hydratase/isomerase family protein, partial [Solirubrobacterales bacterium]|nr:enoyl-CoA hydratase/isomerase family protein [Solirubrobacterales bacterium]